MSHVLTFDRQPSAKQQVMTEGLPRPSTSSLLALQQPQTQQKQSKSDMGVIFPQQCQFFSAASFGVTVMETNLKSLSQAKLLY